MQSFEPQTPNEIAEKIDLNQHTVQVALLELMNTEKNIKWKKIGMYRKYNGGKHLSILSNRMILSWPALFQIILALIS